MIITIAIILILVVLLLCEIASRLGKANLYLVYMQDRLNKIEALMPREPRKENEVKMSRKPPPPERDAPKRKGI